MLKCEYCGQTNHSEREQCRGCGAGLPISDYLRTPIIGGIFNRYLSTMPVNMVMGTTSYYDYKPVSS